MATNDEETIKDYIRRMTQRNMNKYWNVGGMFTTIITLTPEEGGKIIISRNKAVINGKEVKGKFLEFALEHINGKSNTGNQ